MCPSLSNISHVKHSGNLVPRVSQNLGEVTGSLVGNLSTQYLAIGSAGCVVTKVNQEQYDVLPQCPAIIFCKRQGKLIHHLIAEIQVAEGCVVQ